MNQNDKILEIIEKDLDRTITINKFVQEIAEKREERFINFKLGIVAFIAVVFTIIFSSRENFSKWFIFIFLIIVMIFFLLLFDAFWDSSKDLVKAKRNVHESLILAQIRHIAWIEDDMKLKNEFWKYANKAEEINNDNQIIRKELIKGEKIENIIKWDEPKWKLSFYLWFIIVLFLPLLFFLNTLGLL